ncbi:MAG: hydantoinase/oxoprolinase family protein [Anaerolineae bacterium]
MKRETRLNAKPKGEFPLLIGVDVGGTFTDAVAVRGGEVVATAKHPTQPERLEASLLAALDGVLAEVSPEEVTRVAFSTTLITNLLALGRTPEVALLLIPGPGRDPQSYRLPGPTWVVGGAIDFRGRETAPLDDQALDDALDEIAGEDHQRLAIVGKFSPRNPAHEETVAQRARAMHPDWILRTGHTVAAQLNFPRRAVATALTLAVADPYQTFFDDLRAALAQRGLTSPIVVLKADGGTLPLEAAGEAPLQSIFSGPAASTLGALALRPSGATSVVVDVGGTTTDLALILDGEPLLASQGASLEGMALPTRAFAVRSMPVGGDSTVARRDGEITLLDSRAGMAACLGGPAPTLTDALRVLGWTEVGDEQKARASLAGIGAPDEVATAVVEQALARIEAGVEAMFHAWRREPVYRLWELRRKGKRHPDLLVGIGAAAHAVVPSLAERLGAASTIPPYAPVANALGAAVARTTFTTTLHVDTERQLLQIVEEGRTERLPPGRYTLDGVRALARDWMARRGRALGIDPAPEEMVEVLAEQFNVVEGWSTVGRIFDMQLERPCGLVEGWR